MRCAWFSWRWSSPGVPATAVAANTPEMLISAAAARAIFLNMVVTPVGFGVRGAGSWPVELYNVTTVRRLTSQATSEPGSSIDLLGI